MKRRFSSILILIVGLGLACWFVSRLDWRTIGTHLRSVSSWAILLAAMCINLTLLVRSLRWQVFLSPIASTKIGNVFAATTVGFGSVFIFGRTGEIVRPIVLSLRERLPPSVTIATILIERIFDMLTVGALFAISLLFVKLPSNSGGILSQERIDTIHGIGVFLSILVFFCAILLVVFRLKSERLIGLIERKTQRLPRRLMRPIINLMTHLAAGLSILLNVRELFVSGAHTLLIWALVTGATWLVALSFQLNLSLANTIFVLGFGLVGSLVPLPGGSAGAFHAAAAAGLIVLGTERNLAVSISVVLHFVAFGPPFIIGLYYLMRDGIGLGQLREMIAWQETPTYEATSPPTASD